MSEKVSFKQWIENYQNGMYDSPDFDTMCKAGWYDWFCKDSSLINRMKKMVPAILKISKSSKIDLDKTYIFFKNNCPMCGKLYDDFRICDIDSGDVIYTIIPHSGHDSEQEHPSMVWGKDNDFDGAIVKGDMKTVYQFFGV